MTLQKTDGRFKEGNKAAEKWTLESAMELGHGLLDWMEEDGNMFYQEYLCVANDYYEDLIGYLCKKFNPFLELIKKAEKIQEMKLVKGGLDGKTHPAMTIFVLKNHHEYKDKKEVDNRSSDGSMTPKPTIVVKEDLKDEIDKL